MACRDTVATPRNLNNQADAMVNARIPVPVASIRKYTPPVSLLLAPYDKNPEQTFKSISNTQQ